MLYNPVRRGIDFQPEIKIDGNYLEVKDNIRLVGFHLTDNLAWHKNTESLVNRAYMKLWILRRLKALGATKKMLKLVYFQHVRSKLEFGSPAWDGAITDNERKKIERVQRVALSLIFGRNISYEKLLLISGVERLETRRKRISLKFAMKAVKHPKFKSWFKLIEPDKTGVRAHYETNRGRQKRILKSPIPYLTKLLNKHNGYHT